MCYLLRPGRLQMALVEELVSTRQKLERLLAMRGEATEAGKLAEIRETLAEKKAEIELALQSSEVLRSNGVKVAEIDLSPVSARITDIASKFEQEPNSGTVRKGSRWPQLLQSLDSAVADITAQRDQSWADYLTTLFAGLPPEQQEGRIAKTPANLKALRLYRERYARFAALKASPSTSKDALDSLKICSKELEEVKFQLDVPAEISRFFEATVASAGFSLADVTQDTLKWLKDNDMLSQYIVRQRL
jgi:hypothetical protein